MRQEVLLTIVQTGHSGRPTVQNAINYVLNLAFPQHRLCITPPLPSIIIIKQCKQASAQDLCELFTPSRTARYEATHLL